MTCAVLRERSVLRFFSRMSFSYVLNKRGFHGFETAIFRTRFSLDLLRSRLDGPVSKLYVRWNVRDHCQILLKADFEVANRIFQS